MTTLRNVLDDLVDKKLWPIAIALVVALVALPLAFGGGGSGEEPAPRAATPAADGPDATAAAVQLETAQGVDKRTRGGEIRNPFKQLAKKASAGDAWKETDTVSGGSTSTGSGSTITTPGSSGTTTPGSTAPSTAGGSDRKADTRPAMPVVRTSPDAKREVTGYVPVDKIVLPDVVLRFGERGKATKRFTNPDLLTSFPGDAFPAVVFAGVRKDLKAVFFNVHPLVRTSGDGKCTPSREQCLVLQLRQDRTAYLDIPVSATEVERFRLDVARIGSR